MFSVKQKAWISLNKIFKGENGKLIQKINRKVEIFSGFEAYFICIKEISEIICFYWTTVYIELLIKIYLERGKTILRNRIAKVVYGNKISSELNIFGAESLC